MLSKHVFKSIVRRITYFGLVVCAIGDFAQAAGQEPSLSFGDPPEIIRPGRAFTIVYEVSWRGGAADWSIAGPEFESSDLDSDLESELDPVPLSAKSRVDKGLHVVSHAVEFIAKKEGTFEVPAAVFTVFNPEAATPPETTQAGTDPPNPDVHPTLRARPIPVTVRAQRTNLWISSGLGAIFIAAAIGFVALYRARRKAAPRIPDPGSVLPGEAAAHHIHLARRYRLDGNYYEYYGQLANAAGQFGNRPLLERFRARAQEVGYQGVRPPDDELDGALREVEGLLRLGGPSDANSFTKE